MRAVDGRRLAARAARCGGHLARDGNVPRRAGVIGLGLYSIVILIVLYNATTWSPSTPSDAMMPSAMAAASNAYSIAVAPDRLVNYSKSI